MVPNERETSRSTDDVWLSRNEISRRWLSAVLRVQRVPSAPDSRAMDGDCNNLGADAPRATRIPISASAAHANELRK